MTPRRGRAGWVVPALVVLFIGLPILEVFLLVKVGELIGIVPTIGLLIVSAVLGAWLMRREGTKAWHALRDAFGTGKVPGRELSDGALVLAGGLLLTLPGFTTDLVGLICLLPFTRALPRRLLTGLAERQLGLGTAAMRLSGDVIPGEVVEPEATVPNGPKSHDPKSSNAGQTGRAIEGTIIE